MKLKVWYFVHFYLDLESSPWTVDMFLLEVDHHLELEHKISEIFWGACIPYLSSNFRFKKMKILLPHLSFLIVISLRIMKWQQGH